MIEFETFIVQWISNIRYRVQCALCELKVVFYNTNVFWNLMCLYRESFMQRGLYAQRFSFSSMFVPTIEDKFS